MKKLSISLFALLLALSSMNKDLNAQSNSGNHLIFEKETFGKAISNLSDADKLTLENMRLARGKMYKDFTARFKGASNINVSEKGKAVFINCSTDQGFNRIMYDNKGRWQNTVRTYDNEKLVENVRELVENAFPRYAIFGGIIEVHASNKVAYFVTIEDKKSWKRIRVVDGEMDVYEEYTKSK